jgi:hypothetical protein
VTGQFVWPEMGRLGTLGGQNKEVSMSMSRILILFLALVLLGCGDKSDPAPKNKPEPPPTSPGDAAPPATEKTTPQEVAANPPAQPTPQPLPPVGWTRDLKAMRFPAKPAAGKMHGRTFQPQSVDVSRVRGRFLTLRQGEEFNPEIEVKILLSGSKVETFAGKSFEVAPDANAATEPLPPVTLFCKEPDPKNGEPKPKNAEPVIFTNRYALRLEFGQEQDGKLPGKIYLCLPDESRSYLAGTFNADVEPDYSKPPRLDEAPCVAGRIALPPGKEEINVVAGFVGRTVDGTPVSNLTGTVLVPDVETSVTSSITPPQRSTLARDTEAGCIYRHARLTPGRYLVFVGSGDRYIDWRWIEVKDRTPLTFDFALDPKTAGVLEVTLAKDAKDGVRLIPLDETGKVPDIKEAMSALSLAVKTDVPAKDGRVVLDGLRPGRYRTVAGTVEKDVTIKAKETAKVDLSAP